MSADIASQAALPRMVVTGVSGLLGATFALAASRHFEIVGFYGRHPIRIPAGGSESIDLLTDRAVQKRLDEIGPDILVHFAAVTDVDRCEDHPEEAVALNIGATRSLARWAAANGCRLVFMSTDSVFDGRRGRYSEADTPKPVNQYACTKLASEQVVRDLVPDHLVVRASIYGWNAQQKYSLAEWILQRLEAGQSFTGFSDVVFAPLLANTLADIMLALLDRRASGTFHLASANAISKYDFALAIAELFQLPTNLVTRSMFADAGLRAPRPLDTSLCADKACRELELSPPTVLQDLHQFKQLRDAGYPTFLKGLCAHSS